MSFRFRRALFAELALGQNDFNYARSRLARAGGRARIQRAQAMGRQRPLRLHPHLPPSSVAGSGEVGVVRAALSDQGRRLWQRSIYGQRN